MHTKTAGATRPVVVVGNHEGTSHAREYPEGYLLRAFTTCLNLQLRISYVPTQSEQMANANLSMSHGQKALQETNIANISQKLHNRAQKSPGTKITPCLRKASCLLMSIYEANPPEYMCTQILRFHILRRGADNEFRWRGRCTSRRRPFGIYKP